MYTNNTVTKENVAKLNEEIGELKFKIIERDMRIEQGKAHIKELEDNNLADLILSFSRENKDLRVLVGELVMFIETYTPPFMQHAAWTGKRKLLLARAAEYREGEITE